MAEYTPRNHNSSKPTAPLDAYYASDDDYDWVYEHYKRDYETFGYDRETKQ